MYINRFKDVTVHLALLLALYTITRFLFFVFNYEVFTHEFVILLKGFFHGLRFDLSAVFLINGILFLCLLFPFKFVQHHYFNVIYKIVFVAVNSIALLFNCIDLGFYKFTQKRSTYDILNTIGGHNDGAQLLPQYIKDYWYILLIWLLIVWLLYKFTRFKKAPEGLLKRGNKIFQGILLVFVLLPLFIMLGRGGWQYRPIDMITASQYIDGKNSALVLNTPFCIIKSANKDLLEPRPYFSQKQLKSIYRPIHFPSPSDTLNKKNIVLIVMESFGSEYTAVSGNPSLTPFLDSLAGKSHCFTQAFANAKTSITGVPATAVGIPTLFSGSFTYSAYNGNTITGIASLLGSKGYTTSFFHGGNNGTMGFDVLSKAAGYQYYYGRNEYSNDKDYDGNWGIYDEPFFQFFSKKLNNEKQPFMSCMFSLSSHHPYTIPEKYKDTFKGNDLEISKSVSYADHALALFFEKAKKEPWFANTVFIITADHTSLSSNPRYQTDAGIYSIPLIIFEPGKEAQTDNRTIQQIDILPTVMDIVEYDQPYFSFGQSMYQQNRNNFSISYNGQYYQLITDTFCLQFNGEATTAVYNRITDNELKNNIKDIKNLSVTRQENFIKAFIQTYNYCLINNKMTFEGYMHRNI